MNFPIDVNVLIIGGTGQGKSFFINMFDKMSACATLAEAERNPGDFVQPIKFHHEGKYIVEGTHKGGAYSQANSQTQEPTIYEYPTKYGTLRLIDTPGTGDTQGSHVDEKHVEKIISCICQFDKIHAILLFFKSTDNRLDVRVKYQLCELLSCLGKAAVNNIQFIITHGGVRAEPGQAPTVIEGFIQELAVDIPFNESNTFCFENDPLKYLVLKQQGKSSYDEDDVDLFKITYRKTAAQYVRLFARAFNCPQPYLVNEYRALAVARQLWPRLRMTLVETKDVQELIEKAMREHDGNLDQILRKVVEIETELENSKITSFFGDEMRYAVYFDFGLTLQCSYLAASVRSLGAVLRFQGALDPAVVAPVVSPVVASIAALGSGFGLMLGKSKVKRNEERQKMQKHWESEYKSELSRKESEAKALEAQREKYARFKDERAKVKQVEQELARCLHENTALAFTSAKVYILQEELNNSGHKRSMEEMEQLKRMLEEAEEQRLLFQKVSGGDRKQRALTAADILDKIGEVRDFEYYGPPIRQALEDCSLVNTAEFQKVTRAEAARGYMFDIIRRECHPP